MVFERSRNSSRFLGSVNGAFFSSRDFPPNLMKHLSHLSQTDKDLFVLLTYIKDNIPLLIKSQFVKENIDHIISELDINMPIIKEYITENAKPPHNFKIVKLKHDTKKPFIKVDSNGYLVIKGDGSFNNELGEEELLRYDLWNGPISLTAISPKTIYHKLSGFIFDKGDSILWDLNDLIDISQIESKYRRNLERWDLPNLSNLMVLFKHRRGLEGALNYKMFRKITVPAIIEQFEAIKNGQTRFNGVVTFTSDSKLCIEFRDGFYHSITPGTFSVEPTPELDEILETADTLMLLYLNLTKTTLETYQKMLSSIKILKGNEGF